jgi:hypothetical protein
MFVNRSYKLLLKGSDNISTQAVCLCRWNRREEPCRVVVGDNIGDCKFDNVASQLHPNLVSSYRNSSPAPILVHSSLRGYRVECGWYLISLPHVYFLIAVSRQQIRLLDLISLCTTSQLK